MTRNESAGSEDPAPSEAPPEKRRYDSPVRRQQAADTRARIVAAGAELLHGFPVWKWDALTVREVAQRAGVNERTVYRHFASERALRDAVMAHLEGEAGVDLGDLTLADLPAFTTQIFEYVSSFPLEPRTASDPTLQSMSERQHAALLAAVEPATEGWPDRDRAVAAAMLDVLWSLGTYERLVGDWELEPAEAIRAVTWTIGLLQEALAEGRRPGRSGSA